MGRPTPRPLSIALLMALGSALGGCEVSASVTDPGPPREDAPTEAQVPEGPPEGPRTEAVSHTRELRGAWVSSVYNGTWPSATGLSVEAAQRELAEAIDTLAAANMNAVFFQVRPESDALYRSSLEPWSRWLTGVQGRDPGWDPLTFAIERAHERGLELHAWVNPYRAAVSGKVSVAQNHVSKTLAAHAVAYGSQIWMDPGAPAVRAHVRAVLADLLARYDVDGLHFDDYFYPYPVAGAVFDDAASYAIYPKGGGTLAKDDWRRSNVDALVRETAALVAARRPDVRFGISPFGIYRPGTPPGITGLDAYATLYCDPVKWMREGWVDYLAPQLYWTTTDAGQEFGKLVAWWATLPTGGRSVFVGHDVTKVSDEGVPVSEIEAQVTLARNERSRGVRGSMFYSAKPLLQNRGGLRDALVSDFWSTPAATPPLATAVTGAPPPPQVTVTGREARLSADPSVRARAYGVYRGGALVMLAPAARSSVALADDGPHAFTVIDRMGRESAGVVVAP